jgi:type I restriction enzyme R subunit
MKIFIENEPKQQFFKDTYSRLKVLFEILSPDPFLANYIEFFEWITSVYIAFINEFKSEELFLSTATFGDYGEKVKDLIRNSIDYEGITKNFRELRVGDIYSLQKLEQMDDEEKALNLEKMLKQEISINLDTNSAFLKFSERLSAIRKEFEQHQIDLSQRIKKYYELLENIQEKENEANELGLDLRDYGLFVISQEFIKNLNQKDLINFVNDVSKRLHTTLDEGWQNSSKREEFLKMAKQMIQEILLKEYKDKIVVTDFSQFLNRLIDIIIKRF